MELQLPNVHFLHSALCVLQEFEKIPLFMKKAPTEIDPEENPDLACLQSMIFDEERSPEGILFVRMGCGSEGVMEVDQAPELPCHSLPILLACLLDIGSWGQVRRSCCPRRAKLSCGIGTGVCAWCLYTAVDCCSSEGCGNAEGPEQLS